MPDYFEDDGGPNEFAPLGKAQECRRDIEAELRVVDDNIDKISKMRESLERILDLNKEIRAVSGVSIKKLIGTAYVRNVEYVNARNRLISELEEKNA